MQAQQNQSQGWPQISTDTVISDLSQTSLIYDWSEYQIVRTILQEFMGAQSHVGYYFGEVHGYDNKPNEVRLCQEVYNFQTVYDSSMYQQTYNIIQVCQQGEVTYLAVSLCGSYGASALTAYYRITI